MGLRGRNAGFLAGDLATTDSEFCQRKVELLAGLFRSAEPTTEEQQFRHYAEELGLPSQLSRDRTIPLLKESPGRGRALVWLGPGSLAPYMAEETVLLASTY